MLCVRNQYLEQINTNMRDRMHFSSWVVSVIHQAAQPKETPVSSLAPKQRRPEIMQIHYHK